MNASTTTTTTAPTRPAIVQAIEAAIIATGAEMAPTMAREIWRGLAAEGHMELYVPKDKPRNSKAAAAPQVAQLMAEGKTAREIQAALKLSRTVTYELMAEIGGSARVRNATISLEVARRRAEKKAKVLSEVSRLMAQGKRAREVHSALGVPIHTAYQLMAEARKTSALAAFVAAATT